MSYQPPQPGLHVGDRVLVLHQNGHTLPAVLTGVLVQQPLYAWVRYSDGVSAQVLVYNLRSA
ncbi:hypothetical protein AURDEDRAFT_170841 [Auricularia subglabra TFB-10046 SS5]|nr:hypothetical protein AURDEDRAFT_170841 [Auricularia subglabra TFB-10046 SS5]